MANNILAIKLKKLKKPKVKKIRNSGELLLRNSVIIGIITFYLIFLITPMTKALLGSFHDWNPLKGKYHFIGLENYIYALTDKLFWSAMFNNIVFTSIVVFFRVVLSLLIALAITSIKKWENFFRTIYFIPVISSMVAISFVWKWMYEPSMGLINTCLAKLGVQGLNWLLNPKTALLSVIVMTIWKDVGYGIVIYIAGILNLPKDVYEAAEIDGSSQYQMFWKITLPLLKRTTVFVVVTSLISYLQTFTQIFVMTEGGPGTKTYITTYLIYYEAFVKYNFGYASAVSFLLFIVILILTAIQFKVIGRGGYGDE